MAALAHMALAKKDLIFKGGLGVTAVGSVGAYVYLRSKSDHIIEDIWDTIDLLRIRREVKKRATEKYWTIVNVFQEAVNKNPNGVAMKFIDTKTTYTFKEVDEYSNRGNNKIKINSKRRFYALGNNITEKSAKLHYKPLITINHFKKIVANWAASEGLVQGDVVGLIMDNRPEYVITWLGLAKSVSSPR
jgi:hypothetical protein